MKRFLFIGAMIVAAIVSNAQAQGTSPACKVITRVNIISCALTQSPLLQASRETIAAARGQQTAANPILPSNPTLSLSAGRRKPMNTGGSDVTNWYAALSQEIEIANQRGARLETANARLRAARANQLVSARDVAALTWRAFFEVIAAQERAKLTVLLENTARTVATATSERAREGLSALVDAQVARAAALRSSQTRIEAERRHEVSLATLALILGIDPLKLSLNVEGELKPLAVSKITLLSEMQPEVRALRAESEAQKVQASFYKRSRVPNPTLSGFAQNDGFNERVFGLGLAFPIPLPQPLGRTYEGEIAEAKALAKKADFDAERKRREVLLRFATARADYNARQLERSLFTAEDLQGAEQSVNAIADEIRAGRMPLHNALLTQQNLFTFLQDSIEARLALSNASVELARAAGVALERGIQ